MRVFPVFLLDYCGLSVDGAATCILGTHRGGAASRRKDHPSPASRQDKDDVFAILRRQEFEHVRMFDLGRRFSLRLGERISRRRLHGIAGGGLHGTRRSHRCSHLARDTGNVTDPNEIGGADIRDVRFAVLGPIPILPAPRYAPEPIHTGRIARPHEIAVTILVSHPGEQANGALAGFPIPGMGRCSFGDFQIPIIPIEVEGMMPLHLHPPADADYSLLPADPECAGGIRIGPDVHAPDPNIAGFVRFRVVASDHGSLPKHRLSRKPTVSARILTCRAVQFPAGNPRIRRSMFPLSSSVRQTDPHFISIRNEVSPFATKRAGNEMEMGQSVLAGRRRPISIPREPTGCHACRSSPGRGAPRQLLGDPGDRRRKGWRSRRKGWSKRKLQPGGERARVPPPIARPLHPSFTFPCHSANRGTPPAADMLAPAPVPASGRIAGEGLTKGEGAAA